MPATNSTTTRLSTLRLYLKSIHLQNHPPILALLERQPRAKTTAEKEFLALGEGARLWLVEAAAAGTVRMRVKMAAAVGLARLFMNRSGFHRGSAVLIPILSGSVCWAA